MARSQASRSAWELGKHLFGKVGIGRSDLSRSRKRIVREKIHAKARARRCRATM